MHLKKILASCLVLMLISACANQGGRRSGTLADFFTKENVGTAAGAVGGAWIGSNVGKGSGQVAAIAAGTLLGAALGKSVGASLDRADMNYYQRTSQNALENARTGTTSSWSNPDSMNSGTITPTRTYQKASGTHCREYTQTITIDGRTERAHGTACRQSDGTWKLANN